MKKIKFIAWSAQIDKKKISFRNEPDFQSLLEVKKKKQRARQEGKQLDKVHWKGQIWIKQWKE